VQWSSHYGQDRQAPPRLSFRGWLSATTHRLPRPHRGSRTTKAHNPTSGWHQLIRYTLPGAWVALVFVSLSFTPSLLPRSGLFQGVLVGLTGAIGYGLNDRLTKTTETHAPGKE